jgi:hypothetical protein
MLGRSSFVAQQDGRGQTHGFLFCRLNGARMYGNTAVHLERIGQYLKVFAVNPYALGWRIAQILDARAIVLTDGLHRNSTVPGAVRSSIITNARWPRHLPAVEFRPYAAFTVEKADLLER